MKVKTSNRLVGLDMHFPEFPVIPFPEGGGRLNS